MSLPEGAPQPQHLARLGGHPPQSSAGSRQRGDSGRESTFPRTLRAPPRRLHDPQARAPAPGVRRQHHRLSGLLPSSPNPRRGRELSRRQALQTARGWPGPTSASPPDPACPVSLLLLRTCTPASCLRGGGRPHASRPTPSPAAASLVGRPAEGAGTQRFFTPPCLFSVSVSVLLQRSFQMPGSVTLLEREYPAWLCICRTWSESSHARMGNNAQGVGWFYGPRKSCRRAL